MNIGDLLASLSGQNDFPNPQGGPFQGNGLMGGLLGAGMGSGLGPMGMLGGGLLGLILPRLMANRAPEVTQQAPITPANPADTTPNVTGQLSPMPGGLPMPNVGQLMGATQTMAGGMAPGGGPGGMRLPFGVGGARFFDRY